jgi:hypothetical protein
MRSKRGERQERIIFMGVLTAVPATTQHRYFAGGSLLE